MVIVTYFFKGIPLSPHRLLFPISRKDLICAHSQRQDSIYHNLWWTSCGPKVRTENSPNCKRTHHARSICHAGGSKRSQLSALSPELPSAPSVSSTPMSGSQGRGFEVRPNQSDDLRTLLFLSFIIVEWGLHEWLTQDKAYATESDICPSCGRHCVF